MNDTKLNDVQKLLIESLKEALGLNLEEVAEMTGEQISQVLGGLQILEDTLDEVLRKLYALMGSPQRMFVDISGINIEELEKDLQKIGETFDRINQDPRIMEKLFKYHALKMMH